MDLDKLRETHGEVYVLEVLEHRVAVRMPTEAEFDAFMAAATDKAKVASAGKILFRRCCVHPSRAEVDAMLARKPGLGVTLGNKVAELAGLGAEVELGKAET